MTDEELISEYPVLPLRDVVVFPHMIVPLFVGRSKSIKALDIVDKKNTFVFCLTQKDPNVDNPTGSNCYDIGTISRIPQVLKLPDGTLKVLVEGVKRAKVIKYRSNKTYDVVKVVEVEESALSPKMEEKLSRSLINSFDKYSGYSKSISDEVISSLRNIHDTGRLADLIAIHLPLSVDQKQNILSVLPIMQRVEAVILYLQQEIEWMKVDQRMHDKVKEKISQDQREYFKREKLKEIKKELGESDAEIGINEASEYREKIESLGLKTEILDKVLSELNKLQMMSPMSAEATVIRNYLDWIIDLPWKKKANVNRDLVKAEKRLNKDHYGLEKIKDRILEQLAVHNRVKHLKGAILCFVGPPGVGKTSLGYSIANALGRPFVRISLGGVRDEAEIRGHRKTYIGAMPGRIVKAMKRAKAINPLIMLDEVDKMGMDFRGDPASALLEVLDPEQNFMFNDHYLELDYDLSDVLFITTANSLDIPPALLDRMEMIRLHGYTENEKLHIAKEHLLAKCFKDNGIKKQELSISDTVLIEIIRCYTREAGVRSLERCLAKICRKSVRHYLSNKLKKRNTTFHITSRNLDKFLGVKKYDHDVVDTIEKVGMVNGLAWTPVGGELMIIESLVMPGKGELVDTGSLGEVMQESIQAALSIVRAHASKYGIKPGYFQKHDMHIHVPEGATPKDGPSAGIGMVVAILSAITGVPVKSTVAMTGEVTIQGRVLQIGGLKEKLLAALRGNIKQVIIPYENKKDIVELPEEVKKGLDIKFVKRIDEVFPYCLTREPKMLVMHDKKKSAEVKLSTKFKEPLN